MRSCSAVDSAASMIRWTCADAAAATGWAAGAAHALELVGELAQVRVDRAGLVAAADGREVRALDGGAVEGHAVMLRE